ncbi:MMPL family transporter [Actinoplanes sp. NEAU-A12]|uniref:MMPL family transporter n=1 Tax=Actinoplanes sandaracinus TaxID=3045177 RepID=A0ABT6WRI0_9ACTN|nr:MMPL family transporter [Actinoplanes sandaracinus]MDI6102348.1 MMPL family transporter [Actinoplanes sandaracinus]
MSSTLYRVAAAVVRHRARTITLWLLAILVIAGAGNLVSAGTDDEFTIPGSPSQTALDTLSRVFPQVSGASAQLVLTLPDGRGVRDQPVHDAVTDAIDRAKGVEHVIAVISPYDEKIKGAISADGRAAIITVQLDVSVTEIEEETRVRLTAVADGLRQRAGPGAAVLAGGDAFADRVPKLSPTEGLGLLVALMVLLITFGSMIAAGIPLLTAVLGVGLSASLLYGITVVAGVPSTAVMLAVMLGLAVGIDYALFILSRHRDQLRDGLDVNESIARAGATAGSAVVFAGLTVIIALVGLAVAGIPFLTTMGLAAALAVVIAVAIAVTLIPALLAVAGERMRPRPRRRRFTLPEINVFHHWVRLATRRPVITIIVIVLGLGMATLPAGELRLALPDNGSEEHGSAARTTYDTVSEHFGPGHNGPLLVTANIISSRDPVGDMDRLGAEIEALPGVALVALSTPDPKGQVGIIKVIPDSAPDSAATTDLVHRLRALEPALHEKFGVHTAVTGITAVGIDVSARLGAALLPFGLLVAGLSLVLLTMVFRSIAVPVKATAGYLLSVGAAFGATALVFQRGWLAETLHVSHTGSVISFLPIILMGVLFGLAMDYELFLVSRIREEYVHTGDARHAVGAGFRASAPVVVAAAIIMLGVFAAFVPDGSATIKPISFSLAVGVFVDAFLVRMTLVPAVLQLLGDRAWWLPRRLDRALPSLDVEGEGLTRELALADWPEPGATDVVAVAGYTTDILRIGPGEIVEVLGDPGTTRAFLYAIGGRATGLPGEAKTLGLVLPQRASTVRQKAVLVRCPVLAEPGRATVAAARLAPPLLLVEGLDHVPGSEPREAVWRALRDAARQGTTVIVTARDSFGAPRAIDLNPTEVYA